MPACIVVIAEAEADRRLVCDLIDRKIRHHALDWLDPEHLDAYREWRGLEPGQIFTRWKMLKHLPGTPHRQGLRAPGPLGFRGSGAGGYDGAATRKALIRCALATPPPDAVVLVRDMDQQARQRRSSIENECDRVAAAARMTVILALPNAKREAWVLNGFVARSDREATILTRLRTRLNFDPCASAERLLTTSGHEKDAKRVAALLLCGNSDREEACWRDTEWSVLRERGAETGLQSFLNEVQSNLLPVILGRPPARAGR